MQAESQYSIDNKYSMRTGKFEARIDWVYNLVYTWEHISNTLQYIVAYAHPPKLRENPW